MLKLDDFDLAILRCLQVSTRLATEEIGDRVGLSATACQRRIKRLRDDGVIAKEVAILSPRALGERVTLIVEVVLARGRADVVDTFKRDISAVPDVQQVYYVTGECDFVLIVNAASIADYEVLTRRLFFDNENIQKFHTTVVMESVKLGLEVPI
jgi:Lrp/AsnC family leucine-responsive transcriptional regulator